jgi:hypothetical protein
MTLLVQDGIPGIDTLGDGAISRHQESKLDPNSQSCSDFAHASRTLHTKRHSGQSCGAADTRLWRPGYRGNTRRGRIALQLISTWIVGLSFMYVSILITYVFRVSRKGSSPLKTLRNSPLDGYRRAPGF